MSVNPWRPMAAPIDLKHIGKLLEELGEATAAASRCMIQGIDECDPVTGKSNRLWLEEELADVIANISLVIAHFALDDKFMERRSHLKIELLQQWHDMLVP